MCSNELSNKHKRQEQADDLRDLIFSLQRSQALLCGEVADVKNMLGGLLLVEQEKRAMRQQYQW